MPFILSWSNLHPISLLPAFSKILEKHVHTQLSSFAISCNLLPPSQSGFGAGLTLFSYADDSQIIFSLSNAQNLDPSPLRQGLTNVTRWVNRNALKHNGNKTEVMILHNNPKLWGVNHWPVSLGPLPTPVNKVKNLGFIIKNLSLKPQVSKLTASCFSIHKWLKKILWLIPLNNQRNVLHPGNVQIGLRECFVSGCRYIRDPPLADHSKRDPASLSAA